MHDKTRAKEKIRASLHGASASSTDGRIMNCSAPVGASGSGVRDPSVATGHPLALYHAHALACE